MKEIKSVTIVGAGNVASWFAFSLSKQPVEIREIYSRSLARAEELANRYGATAINEITELTPESDLYIFALKDDIYNVVLDQIPFKIPLAVHTSGSLSMQILSPYATRFGVLYPYQTLSLSASFDGLTVPLCIEGCDGETTSQLERFASSLSEMVSIVEEKDRFTLHLAAVFASNFTNALYGIAYELLQQSQIDWKLIIPLLQYTLDKTKQMEPRISQTGPAKRGDHTIMQFHLEQLNREELKEIYSLLSKYIQTES